MVNSTPKFFHSKRNRFGGNPPSRPPLMCKTWGVFLLFYLNFIGLFGTLVLKQFLLASLHEIEMFVKSLSANALKYISLLTNFSFHGPAPPRVVLRGVGKIQIPHAFWFFFAFEKEHYLCNKKTGLNSPVFL